MTGIPDGAPVATVAGRYRLRELVGTGGMGSVWRAGDELLGREVALKQVRLTDQPIEDIALARERTMREARIAAALHHPHIVSIFDVVVERDEPWLVLEFLPSRSLGSVLTERGTLPPVEVAAIGADVAGALAAAHAAEIVHRDVKPDNVLLSRPSAAGPVVKLTDFGISHIATVPAITATHVLAGTPAYFAPETARGEGTDSRSDVYSLGATLYTAVEGRPPFGSDTGNVLALLARVGRGEAPLPRRAGPLADLLRRLMADDPAARPTAAQARDALRRIAGGGPEPVTTITGAPAPARVAEPEPAGRRPRRILRPVAAVAVALTVAAGVVVAIGAFRPGGVADRAAPVTMPATASVMEQVGVGDPATADPCSLLDVASLQGFGTVRVEPDNNAFSGCAAEIDRPGGVALYEHRFVNSAQVTQYSSGYRAEEAGFAVVDYEPEPDTCSKMVLLGDGNAITFTADDYRDRPSGADMCAILAAARTGVLTRLVEQGIGRRARLDESSPLAAVPACDLLASEDIAAVVPNPTPARPRFADWGCDWVSFTGESRLAVAYYRALPLDDGDGAPADFAGHPGRVLGAAGNCQAQFVQRGYTAQGGDHIEVVVVIYEGQGADTELCRTATALATAAAARLPPPRWN
jgi:tRNA A-37 threonylcarbamoyl transferase component Bud32